MCNCMTIYDHLEVLSHVIHSMKKKKFPDWKPTVGLLGLGFSTILEEDISVRSWGATYINSSNNVPVTGMFSIFRCWVFFVLVWNTYQLLAVWVPFYFLNEVCLFHSWVMSQIWKFTDLLKALHFHVICVQPTLCAAFEERKRVHLNSCTRYLSCK